MNKKIRLEVWEKYGRRCAYCGCKLEYKQMQVDHIQSKAHHKYYNLDNPNRIENLNPACRQCNFYKGGGTLEAFRDNLSSLYKRINKIFIVRLAVKHGILQQNVFDGKFYFEKYNGVEK